MPVYKRADGAQMLETFMKAWGGPPRDWYVGISHDAADRLGQHGMEASPTATLIEFEDEAAARSVQEQFLRSGVQGDNGGGPSEGPPRQVYVYRAPKLTSFREFLRKQEQEEAEVRQRKARKEEWVGAVGRLIGKFRTWLQEADPAEALEVAALNLDKAEQGLGEYRAPGLEVRLAEAAVQIVPVARNVVGTVGLPGGGGLRAEGRVDATNGLRKYTLYRTLKDGKERWHVAGADFELSPLDQDRFMAIMEDLLS